MTYAPFDLGGRKHVFVDWDLIEPGYGLAFGGERPESWETPHGVELTPHLPYPGLQRLVAPEHPWEAMIGGYSTLFEDEGRYRLYYDCRDMAEGDDLGMRTMLAYAESTDGVSWVKPNVGTVEYNGSRDNNLVYGLDLSLGRHAIGAYVFKDPAALPDEAYKLVHMGGEGGRFYVWGAVSPDGLRWRALERPLLSDYMSDTQTVVGFDADRGVYVGYFRGWTAHEHGSLHHRRTIAYAETDQFESWPTPRTLVTADMHDGPDTDIYTSAYTPWPGADAHLMFPAFYRRNPDVTEVHMMTSRDGRAWQRPLRQAVVPAGEPGSGSEGGVYAGCGLASLRAGEWSLPIVPRPASHNQGSYVDRTSPESRGSGVWAATWRQDGFVSLQAESEGACSTMLLTFTGNRLEVNAWTRFGGEIRVELADASAESRSTHATPIPGRSFQDCDAITGDHVSRTVTWGGESDVSPWAGKPVRVRLQMRRARLYAMQFVGAEQ